MIGYVTLGTNNIDSARTFYNSLFGPLGFKLQHNYKSFLGWQMCPSDQLFCITKPFDRNEATSGNGTMVAIKVSSPEQVDKAHGLALSLGAEDEGAPGPRALGYYCGYVRDLDNNKLNLYCVLKTKPEDH